MRSRAVRILARKVELLKTRIALKEISEYYNYTDKERREDLAALTQLEQELKEQENV